MNCQMDNITYVVNEDVLGSTSLCVSLVGGDPEFMASGNGNLERSKKSERLQIKQLTSVSSFIKPVLISGPLVSRAMAMGRPDGLLAAAARALSMTDWWYS